MILPCEPTHDQLNGWTVLSFATAVADPRHDVRHVPADKMRLGPGVSIMPAVRSGLPLAVIPPADVRVLDADSADIDVTTAEMTLTFRGHEGPGMLLASGPVAAATIRRCRTVLAVDAYSQRLRSELGKDK